MPNSTLLLVAFMLICLDGRTQDQSQEELKRLSLEELMNIEVMSVSKRPEKLNETASAIQVITNEDIKRFGASTIPETLYLAGNLQVAQKGAHAWGVSSRGFNTDLANKLLVLMDGRTIYTPLFSGVFWERQDYLLEDIDHIEVISGPGATLWGANAVNGVINITSKKASDTQGLFVEEGGGNEVNTLAGARYGGKIGSHVFYRVYGKYLEHNKAVFANDSSAHDGWHNLQGGFRMDADLSENSVLTFQGDAYQTPADLVSGRTSKVNGANVLSRWTHTFRDSSEISIQSYYDHTYLYDPTPALTIGAVVLAPEGVFKDQLSTYDFDFQHHFRIWKSNRFIWGFGYRHTDDENTNAPSLGFLPSPLRQNLLNAFGQLEIGLCDNLLLTAGTKVEHNDYTGIEIEPSGRLRWEFADRQMIWGAVSRSVRMPSRIDRDLTEGTPPYFVLLVGGPDFQSENVIADELGYRTQFADKVTTSLSFFFNSYNDIRSTVLNPVTVFPLNFENGLAAETYGFELNIGWEVTDWWQLTTSYNRLHEHLWVSEGKTDFNQTHNETADPKWQFSLRSAFSLPDGVSINPAFRWVDQLPINNAGTVDLVPSYSELDIRIGWTDAKAIEVSVTGRNLLHDHHPEYGLPLTREEIERSVYTKISVHF